MKNNNLSFDEFLYRLKQEYEYHKNGGTKYRTETAKLSLEIAMKVKKANPFLDPLTSKQLVINYLPFLDDHRKNDVAKMLRVIAKNIYIEKNTPDEVKQYIENKSKNKKILKSINKKPPLT